MLLTSRHRFERKKSVQIGMHGAGELELTEERLMGEEKEDTVSSDQASRTLGGEEGTVTASWPVATTSLPHKTLSMRI